MGRLGLVILHHFEPQDEIGGLQLPMMLSHGTADAKVPYEVGEQLYSLAAEPQELLFIDGAMPSAALPAQSRVRPHHSGLARACPPLSFN